MKEDKMERIFRIGDRVVLCFIIFIVGVEAGYFWAMKAFGLF